MSAVAVEVPVTTVDPDVSVTARRLRPGTVKALTVAADGVVIALAMVASYAVRQALSDATPAVTAPAHLLFGALFLPVWLAIFARYRLYSSRAVEMPLRELERLIYASAGAVALMAMSAFMLSIDVARGWLVLTLAFAVTLLAAERAAVRAVFVRQRRRRRFLRPVVVVGDNEEGRALRAMLEGDPQLGYDVLDVVGVSRVAAGSGVAPVPGLVGRTLDAVQRVGATGVVIATTALDLVTSNLLVRELSEAGIHVELSSSLRDIAADRLSVRPLGRFPVVYLAPAHRGGWRWWAKNAFDLTLAAVVLVLGLPLLAVIAIAVKLDSPGPVLYRQRRLGRRGAPFPLLKFRSMVVGADSMIEELRHRNDADGALFKIRDDPRITRVGRFLRRTSLDELPQFWNVLRGDMSVVGPRPALPAEARTWSLELHQRLEVKPGITGMWQVEGHSAAGFDSYARLDLFYVDNWSLVRDLVVVAKTVPTMVSGRRRY